MSGWDEVRNERFRKQKELGFFTEDTELTPRNPKTGKWDSLDTVQKEPDIKFKRRA